MSLPTTTVRTAPMTGFLALSLLIEHRVRFALGVHNALLNSLGIVALPPEDTPMQPAPPAPKAQAKPAPRRRTRQPSKPPAMPGTEDLQTA